MNELASLYRVHLEQLTNRYAEIMALEQLDGVVIHSGQLMRIFLDDQHYPFKVNPHFRQWLPGCEIENCWLVLQPAEKPQLIYFQPENYWQNSVGQPQPEVVDAFDIVYLVRSELVRPLLPESLANFAYIGPNYEVAEILGFELEMINPEPLLNFLHYHRAWKTEYEISCLQRANEVAVKGHIASRAAFYQGASEFEIYLEYLGAVGQNDADMPYSAIIATNEHGATLHYTQRCRRKMVSQERRSLLIDAGASYNGYGADISRTYSFRRDYFSELVQKMEQLQLQLLDSIKIGLRFTELHQLAYQQVAQLLVDEEIILADKQQVLELDLVRYFFPHGVGHHIGLQTHDVAGLMQDERGTHLSAPEQYPFLRCTRLIEAEQVITVEPGLYFIPMLLKTLSHSAHSSLVNWEQVNTLSPFGGIRIEDNLLIKQGKNVNLTREQNWQ